MNSAARNPAPETLPEKITNEALSILSLGGAKGIRTIAPLEAALPPIITAWELPEAVLKEKTALLERGKAQAAAGEAILPEREFLVSYDGFMIVQLLWDLFRTAVRLEAKEARKAVYGAALLSMKALDLREWVSFTGKVLTELVLERFKAVVDLESYEGRAAVYDRALRFTDGMNLKGNILRCM